MKKYSYFAFMSLIVGASAFSEHCDRYDWTQNPIEFQAVKGKAFNFDLAPFIKTTAQGDTDCGFACAVVSGPSSVRVDDFCEVSGTADDVGTSGVVVGLFSGTQDHVDNTLNIVVK